MCKIIISIIIVFLLCVPAYAQVDVEKATREVDRSLRSETEEKLRLPPPKIPEIEREEKKIAEGPKFFVKKIQLMGCESFSPDEFKSITERYENKEVSLEELNILAKEIEREYLRKGIIAACIVTPQEIKEGLVFLQIIEAKMGELEIQDHKYFKKDRVAYYWKLKPYEVLRYEAISRSLQLMNKNPDKEVRTRLQAGKKPQTTDVLLKVNTHFPVHLTHTYDREGVISTGRARPGFGIRHNNFLGLDDTLLTGFTFGKDFKGNYVYHKLPITNFGTSLLYGYSYSKSFPKKEYESYGIDSRAKNSSFFIHQDIFNKDDYLGEINFGIDAKDKTIKMNTGTVNRDRLRILRLGANLVHKDYGGITYISPEFSQGINLFGARRRNSLSSRGSENTFSKFNLGIQHKKMLPLGLQAILKFDSQITSSKLASQEEFSLGGMNSVRGYPAGDYLADNALEANLELLIPAFFIPEKIRLPYANSSLKEGTKTLLFFDYGYGRRRGITSTEKETRNLKSAGLGLRTQLYKHTFLRLEWGFPFGDDTITENSNSRFHFAVDFKS